MKIEKEKINRIEVIGKSREYVNIDCNIKDIVIQDDGKTIKIFLEKKRKTQINNLFVVTEKELHSNRKI